MSLTKSGFNLCALACITRKHPKSEEMQGQVKQTLDGGNMRRISPFRYLLYMVMLLVFAMPSFAQVRISVSFGPPALPVYEQPLCPSEGYMWVPGYWAWDDDYDDYYWVPGTWVLAPEPGFLWTPPYWAWSDGAFVFYEGYWGPEV